MPQPFVLERLTIHLPAQRRPPEEHGTLLGFAAPWRQARRDHGAKPLDTRRTAWIIPACLVIRTLIEMPQDMKLESARMSQSLPRREIPPGDPQADDVLEHFALSCALSEEEALELLEREIVEVREARDPEDIVAELHDAYYALYNLAVVKLGRAVRFDHNILANKVLQRLGKFGTISQRPPDLGESALASLRFDVIHFAFGTFRQPWQRFDPFKNGTEAEIADCTDRFAGNHVIVTFDAVDQLSYTFLCSSFSKEMGNTLLIRIPDWLFNHARDRKAYGILAPYLTAQVRAALSNIRLSSNPIYHFHSWESGFLIGDGALEKQGMWVFSPYLTVGRLLELIRGRQDMHWTLPLATAEYAADWEGRLCRECDDVLVESDKDREFYSRRFGDSKVRKVSFLRTPEVRIQRSMTGDPVRLVAGGRAVAEKGFDHLIRHFLSIEKDPRFKGRDFSLVIFCREHSRKTGRIKYPEHLAHLEALAGGHPGIELRDKVSEGELRDHIRKSDLLVVPSVFDPFCLMPQYAWEVGTPCLVSHHAGISELVGDQRFVFDPVSYDDFSAKLEALMRREFEFALSVPENSESFYLEAPCPADKEGEGVPSR